MSFDSLANVSGFILILSILLIAYGIQAFVSKKRIGIFLLTFFIISLCVSLRISCSIDDDLYHSSNNSYSIRLCDMYYDNEVLMTKDRYNISFDGYDSDIKIWAYNTEKVRDVFNKYNDYEHYYDYLQVSSIQNKITPSVISSLIFKNSTLKDFVKQDVKVVSNTGVVTTTGSIKSQSKDGKTYYLINEYLFCGEDIDNKISEITDNGEVTLHFAYDKSYANGNEFFRYKIIDC